MPNKNPKGPTVPFFETPEELSSLIDEYFEKGMKIRKVVVGKGDKAQIVEVPVPTLSGLCHYLGFASRQSLYDYEKKEEFSYIIKRAKLAIEVEYEELLQSGTVSPAGPIFILKNFGWKDKTDLDVTSKGKSIRQIRKVRIIRPDDKGKE